MKKFPAFLLALVLMLTCSASALACTDYCGVLGPYFDTEIPTEEDLQIKALQRINKAPADIIGKTATVVHYGNIRITPHKYATSVGTAYYEAEYTIIAYEVVDGSVWLQIPHYTGSAWISASLVEISGEFDKKDARIGMGCRITVNSGRARMGAGTDNPIIEYVGYNDKFTILDVSSAPDGTTWFQIRKDGNLCWISSGIVVVEGYGN